MPEKRKRIRVSSQQLLEAYRAEQTKFDFLQRRQQQLQQVLAEMLTASEAIKELRKAKRDENVLVSLGAGTYAEAKMGSVQKVKTSLAGNVLIDSNSEEAERRLQQERQKIEKNLVELQQERKKVLQNLRNFERVFSQVRQRAARSVNYPRLKPGASHMS